LPRDHQPTNTCAAYDNSGFAYVSLTGRCHTSLQILEGPKFSEGDVIEFCQNGKEVVVWKNAEKIFCIQVGGSGLYAVVGWVGNASVECSFTK